MKPLDLGDMATLIAAIVNSVLLVVIAFQYKITWKQYKFNQQQHKDNQSQFSMTSFQNAFFSLYDEKKIKKESRDFAKEYDLRISRYYEMELSDEYEFDKGIEEALQIIDRLKKLDFYNHKKPFINDEFNELYSYVWIACLSFRYIYDKKLNFDKSIIKTKYKEFIKEYHRGNYGGGITSITGLLELIRLNLVDKTIKSKNADYYLKLVINSITRHEVLLEYCFICIATFSYRLPEYKDANKEYEACLSFLHKIKQFKGIVLENNAIWQNLFDDFEKHDYSKCSF